MSSPILLSTPVVPLFPEAADLGDYTLAGTLLRHARAVESCLILAGQEPGVAYTALGVLRVAASLVAIPDDPNGSRPWSLPEIGHVHESASFATGSGEESDLPF